ncbi:hypothetical protein [Saccharopolyspora pogona]|uniref:hypothetical protein n=1 Tax=Saccharopolyspora pogona TaxID=333966 RepID=UPI00168736AE|nr:hypothetical protein [Saccharopolyspora pogona]
MLTDGADHAARSGSYGLRGSQGGPNGRADQVEAAPPATFVMVMGELSAMTTSVADTTIVTGADY